MDPFTEDHLVEQPAIQILQHDLGWEVVNCYDEWSGGVSNQGRDGKREVVLVSRLRTALPRLNPDLPVEAIEGAGEEICRDDSGNRMSGLPPSICSQVLNCSSTEFLDHPREPEA